MLEGALRCFSSANFVLCPLLYESYSTYSMSQHPCKTATSRSLRKDIDYRMGSRETLALTHYSVSTRNFASVTPSSALDQGSLDYTNCLKSSRRIVCHAETNLDGSDPYKPNPPYTATPPHAGLRYLGSPNIGRCCERGGYLSGTLTIDRLPPSSLHKTNAEVLFGKAYRVLPELP